MKKTFFLFNSCIFDLESESEIHFRQPEAETLDNLEKQNFLIIGGFRCRLTKINTGERNESM